MAQWFYYFSEPGLWWSSRVTKKLHSSGSKVSVKGNRERARACWREKRMGWVKDNQRAMRENGVNQDTFTSALGVCLYRPIFEDYMELNQDYKGS
jgi:hypothetical protein